MNTLLSVNLLLTVTVIGALYHANPQTRSPPNFALLNGHRGPAEQGFLLDVP
jgi:hypothetical protein